MHFVGDQFAAVDVLDHVPVEVSSPDGAGHPGDVPAPDLVGAICPVCGQRTCHRRLAASTALSHASGLEHSVESGFAGQVQPFVGQFGNDLVRG